LERRAYCVPVAQHRKSRLGVELLEGKPVEAKHLCKVHATQRRLRSPSGRPVGRAAQRSSSVPQSDPLAARR
jgi:hypothetical protein